MSRRTTGCDVGDKQNVMRCLHCLVPIRCWLGMPARGGKRKASPTEESTTNESLMPALKRGRPSETDIASNATEAAEMPTNKVLPPSISYPRASQGATRIVAWNICEL